MKVLIIISIIGLLLISSCTTNPHCINDVCFDTAEEMYLDGLDEGWRSHKDWFEGEDYNAGKEREELCETIK